MKIQIARFSPHQNAKVFAVLMAIASLLFGVPMFTAFLFIPPGMDAAGNPASQPPAAIAFLFPCYGLHRGGDRVLVL
jgi:hypothetical protein